MKYCIIVILCLVALESSYAQETSPVETTDVNLGSFSMSLAVSDISTSLAFYQKLGFKPLKNAGSVDQKWIILINGTTKIGLFQGLFPTNTLTFNPTDGRKIDKILKQGEVEYLFESGLDQAEGPCSFTFLDPDGNPILIDQP